MALLLVMNSLAWSGAIDRSGQPFTIILGEGNVFEMHSLSSDIHYSGKVTANLGAGPLATQNVNTGNVASKTATNPMIAMRYQINERLVCALQYETPFMADASYRDDSLSYQANPTDVSSQIPAPLDTYYRSKSLTSACGLRFGNTLLVAGPRLQEVSGGFSSDLSSFNLGDLDNAQVELNGGTEWGYMLGASYAIPGIHLKLSMFYHSAIDYDLTGVATTPTLDFSSKIHSSVTTNTRTPEAVVINFQTGIAPGWLLGLDVRWSHYKQVDDMQVVGAPVDIELELFGFNTLDMMLTLFHKLDSKLAVFTAYRHLNSKWGESGVPQGADGKSIRFPRGLNQTLMLGAKYQVIEDLNLIAAVGYTNIPRHVVNDGYYQAVFDGNEAVNTLLGMQLSF